MSLISNILVNNSNVSGKNIIYILPETMKLFNNTSLTTALGLFTQSKQFNFPNWVIIRNWD